MKTFEDLDFIKMKVARNHVQWNAQLDLGCGLILSVAYGDYVYSSMISGEPETYEVALWFGNDLVPLASTDEVLGWQTKDHINHLIEQISNNKNFVKEKMDKYYE